ncbi:hypothetical protein [Streptomyces sp. NPDC019507]|uniref:hypothetical protein n=1 Tax=Streptomyces sp. NPDC019507 TaxID=3154689 RepID=UPI0034005B18
MGRRVPGARGSGLLDILLETFGKIPETLDTATKKDVTRIEQAVKVREWMERMTADAGS